MYRWRVYLFIQRFQQNPVIIHVNHCLLYLEMKPISFYQWVILKDIQKDIYVIEPKQKPNYIIWDWCPNTLTKGENFFFTIFWIFYIGYRAPSSIIFLIDFFLYFWNVLYSCPLTTCILSWSYVFKEIHFESYFCHSFLIKRSNEIYFPLIH